jgi:hypothetical protein
MDIEEWLHFVKDKFLKDVHGHAGISVFLQHGGFPSNRSQSAWIATKEVADPDSVVKVCMPGHIICQTW